MQLKDALRSAVAILEENRVGSPRMNAEVLLMFVLGCDRAYLYAHPERELSVDEQSRYEEALEQRARGVPAQYITGHQEFWGLDFIVGPAVLIPRPETEHLVEAVLELCGENPRPSQPQARPGHPLELCGENPRPSQPQARPGHPELPRPVAPTPGAVRVGQSQDPSTRVSRAEEDAREPSLARDDITGTSARELSITRDDIRIFHPRIVDVGTGSGCVALALASELPQAEIHATEISEDALEIARANAARLRLDQRVTFHCTDLLQGVGGEFDIVASNPPYVGESEYDKVQLEVRKFEPRRAVFAGLEGMDVIRRLAPQARAALRPGGWLAMEIGFSQEAAVREVLREWREVSTIPDLQGIPRVVVARK